MPLPLIRWIALVLVIAPLAASCGSPGSGAPVSISYPVSGPVSAPSPSVLDSEELAFVGLLNSYRQQQGLVALQLSASLTAASQWLAQDMAANNYLDHTDSLGRDFVTRLADFGYAAAMVMGENVAAGNAEGQPTFTQWQNSPPHNANMLGADYRALGVGRAYNAGSDYGWYWATDFGSTVDATLPLDQRK